MSNWFFIEGPSGPAGAVTEGNVTEDNKVGSSTTQTFSHTFTASGDGKDALQVKVSSTDMAASVTYNGIGLTLAREDGFGTSNTSIWTILNSGLSTGTFDVVVTYDSAISNAYVSATDMFNVHQLTPLGNVSGSALSSDTVSNSVTISLNSLAVDVATNDFYDFANTGPVQQVTVYLALGSGDLTGYSSYNSDQSAGSRTFTWDGGFSSDSSHSVVEYLNG